MILSNVFNVVGNGFMVAYQGKYGENACVDQKKLFPQMVENVFIYGMDVGDCKHKTDSVSKGN